MIFVLDKDNLALAKEEVLALAGRPDHEIYENILICQAEFDYSRLAYTKKVLLDIFVSDTIEEVDWEVYYHDNFCARSNITSREKELAKIIWDSVENPKVKLVGSQSEFWFYFIGDKVICGKLVFRRREKFHLRRPDLRPGFFPVSLKPKLARALINLSGVIEGVIWDPFCGTGGLILEGSLIGLSVIGTDIDKSMIKAAHDNFKHYGVEGDISVADARSIVKRCDAIVTDPPYGRRASLKNVKIEELYSSFLHNVYPKVSTVVLMAPKELKIESPYTVIFETEDFVHASLTRKILILKKLN